MTTTINNEHKSSFFSNYIYTPSKLRITMTTKTIREIALAWKCDKQRYVKQSTYAAYVLVFGEPHSAIIWRL